MKLAFRIITLFLVALLLAIVAALATLESWLPATVRALSPDYLSGAQISIQKVDIDWKKADIKLGGIDLTQNGKRQAYIGTLAINLSDDKIISRLLEKQLTLNGLLLSNAQLNLREKDGHWSLKGLKFSSSKEPSSSKQLSSSKEPSSSKTSQLPATKQQAAEAQAPKEPTPQPAEKEWEIIANNTQLKDIKVAVHADQFASNVHIANFQLDQFNSQPESLNSKIELALTLSDSYLNVNLHKLHLTGSPQFNIKLSTEGQRKRPEISGRFSARDISLALKTNEKEKVQKLASIDSIELEEFYSNALNQENSQLKQLSVKGVQLLTEDHQQGIDTLSISNIEHHFNSEQAEILVQGLTIEGIESPLHFLENYQLASLNEMNKLLTLLSTDTSSPAIPDPAPAPNATPAQSQISNQEPDNSLSSEDDARKENALRFTLENVQLKNSKFLIYDTNYQPTIEAPLEIKQFAIDQFDSANTESLSRWVLEARLDEQGLIHSKGMLKPLSNELAMQATLKLEHINLVNLSPYFEKQTGYFIHTGQLSLDSQSQLDGKQLQSKNKVDLQSIELDRVAADKADKVDRNISMPLDSALELLRNDQGDIELNLPVNGDISSPAFGSGDILRQVSSRALREASVAYLKYAFQPYGTLITVGSWLNDQAQKIRLDALSFNHGQSELTLEQQAYLQKLGQLLQKKEQLRVRACPVISGLEESWIKTQIDQQTKLNNENEKPQEPDSQAPAVSSTSTITPTDAPAILEFKDGNALAKARMAALKQFMQDNFAIGPDRLLSCKLQSDNKIPQSYIHLEI